MGGAAIPQVMVGDLNMYYEVHGHGEPLVLVAGLGSDLSEWALQTPEFSKKYSVVTFDNRGAGRTDAPDMPYSIRMMSGDTLGLMDVLGIDQAHVLGVSMGGYIAQELAIRHPGRVKSLILVSTSAGPYLIEAHVLTTWAAAAIRGISQKTFFQLMLPFIFTDRLFEDPEMVQIAVNMIATPHSTTPAYALVRQLMACVEHDARGRLGRITAPALVLAGKDDILVPFSLSEELATSIPKAKLVVLYGGGHGFNTEIPDKFNQAVLEFLTEVA
ncbi:MAG: alpha/beta fold hydrolase [Chloroflexi bacterium]|nr:alpha/beta fold hydrolase [Chloroflexota bacterium]